MAFFAHAPTIAADLGFSPPTMPGSRIQGGMKSVNALAPEFTDYIPDDSGARRRHVKRCINDTAVIDRSRLSSPSSGTGAAPVR